MYKSLSKSSIFLFFLVLMLSACNPVSFQKANEHYKVKDYAVAADMYAKVYKNSKSSKKEK